MWIVQSAIVILSISGISFQLIIQISTFNSLSQFPIHQNYIDYWILNIEFAHWTVSFSYLSAWKQANKPQLNLLCTTDEWYTPPAIVPIRLNLIVAHFMLVNDVFTVQVSQQMRDVSLCAYVWAYANVVGFCMQFCRYTSCWFEDMTKNGNSEYRLCTDWMYKCVYCIWHCPMCITLVRISSVKLLPYMLQLLLDAQKYEFMNIFLLFAGPKTNVYFTELRRTCKFQRNVIEWMNDHILIAMDIKWNIWSMKVERSKST